MATTLNPQLDVVFKLLFAAEANRDLLVALLNDVLQPPKPIVSVQVVNPDIDKDVVEDRGLILDIHAVHSDGTRTDIEMQTRDRGATERRALYHWARLYRDGIQRGDDFSDLTPCRVVFFLSFSLFPDSQRLHSRFLLLEADEYRPLTDDLELHFVELSKLEDEPVDAKDGAAVWARFLAAKTDQERKELSMANPNIQKATEALEALSQDPQVQALARWREDQLRLHRVEMAAIERRGHEAGRQEGEVEELRATLRQLCDLLGLERTPEREAAIATGELELLRALKQHLFTHRSWPDP